MTIDMLASAPHYVDHLAAVWSALEPSERGWFVGKTSKARARIEALGFRAASGFGDDHPTVVASSGDLVQARARHRARIALMEHGAGQSYGGRPNSKDHSSYAGGNNRGAVSLFLHPGEHPASRDHARYPRAKVAVVGSPFLDTLPQREGTPDRVVAVTMHFNAGVCSETRSSLQWIFPAIAELPKKGYTVIGTAHPLLFEAIAPRYRHVGIRPVRDFRDVCRMADLLIFDNTSAGPFFAATGRPVVVLNPPGYSRKAHHGLRFWEAAGIGVNCDSPRSLVACIEEAFADSDEQRQARERAVDLFFAFRSGAAKRAANVLEEWAA